MSSLIYNRHYDYYWYTKHYSTIYYINKEATVFKQNCKGIVKLYKVIVIVLLKL